MCFAVMANIFLLEDDKILSKGISIALEKDKHTAVSYTHLDVYKRQPLQGGGTSGADVRFSRTARRG